MNRAPTGHVHTELPLSELDPGQFEQFCTDLLNLHPAIDCLRGGEVVSRRIADARRLLGGKDQAGGDIRADVESGEVWVIQCKRVRQFGASEVSAAITDAEQRSPHADQYVLVTTCGLSLEAQLRLSERPRWMWWDPSRLTTMAQTIETAEHGMNLVLRHFDKPWVKRLFVWGDQPLLTWEDFFAGDLNPERIRFHHRTKFVERGDVLDRLEDFARQGAGRALILSAAGGQGKSRLLLEFARRCEQRSATVRVRFLNLSRRGLTEDQSDFLGREKDLILVVDDAHRLDAALGDVAKAASRASSVRLLVATRPHAVEAMNSQLYRQGYEERLEATLNLGPWSPGDMHALANSVLDPAHHSEVPRLVGLADRCPLLVVLGGTLINAGQMAETVTDDATFRERVFKGFKEDFLRLQPEGHRARLDRLMQFLSFVAPTPRNDHLLKQAADLLGCPPLDVADDLNSLLAARLLVENREGIRLYPDLFADAVLLDACIEPGGEVSTLYRTVLDRVSAGDFPAMMRNLAQADWEVRARKGTAGSLFDPIWKEFVRCFEQGRWFNPETGVPTFLPWRVIGLREESVPDRATLLGQWAPLAAFLPERTLELADLALRSIPTKVGPDGPQGADTSGRAQVSAVLPPILKPLVIWQPEHAKRALDLLWSLEAPDPCGNWHNSSNAIAVLAETAGFACGKPLESSECFLEWLEQKLQDPAALERVRRQPWLISALLKPLFEHTVDQQWLTGKTLHVRSWLLRIDRLRPLRRRALAIAERFLNADDVPLSLGVVPVVGEALDPLRARFGAAPTTSDHEAWRTDRLEAVRVVERAIRRPDSPMVRLLQLRRLLAQRCAYDPDPEVKAECRRLFGQIPETFELRVARALTAYPHEDWTIRSESPHGDDFQAATEAWGRHCQAVAQEMVERFPTAPKLCDFLRHQVRELAGSNLPILGDALLGPTAGQSAQWCASLLTEMVNAREPELDAFTGSVLRSAASEAPDAYREVVAFLPGQGRPEQLRAMIEVIGWREVHAGGSLPFEWDAVLQATERTEETVTVALASVAGRCFGRDPQKAMQLLTRLKPSNESSADPLLRALRQVAEQHGAVLRPEEVAACLRNLEMCLVSDTPSSIAAQRTLAARFPIQIYEQVRTLAEQAETGATSPHRWRLARSLPLGRIPDAAYVDREVERLWLGALHAERRGFAQECRLGLIRSLLAAEPTAALDRIQKLIAACALGGEVEVVARLLAPPGETFVFQHPALVRSILTLGRDLHVGEAVQQTLLESAVGGARTWTDGRADPEYRHIIEQGEALANRYRSDPVLGDFYHRIADAEGRQQEFFRRRADAEDDFD